MPSTQLNNIYKINQNEMRCSHSLLKSLSNIGPNIGNSPSFLVIPLLFMYNLDTTDQICKKHYLYFDILMYIIGLSCLVSKMNI